MTPQFRACLEQVLKYEGGYVNHPKDPGGATNKGVTIGTFRRYYPGASVTDLKNMTKAQLERIYYEGYWKPIDGDGLGPGVDLAVFDLAVNSGIGRAKKYFKRVMHLHNVDNARLVDELCDIRMDFLRGLKTWPVFGRGWTARVTHVRKTGIAWALAQKALRKTTVPKEVETDRGHAKGLNLIDLFFEALTELVRKIFR